MKDELKKKLVEEFNHAKNLFRKGDYTACFSNLEIIHVLGQKSVYWHTIAHLYMLRVGLKTANMKEIMGQAIRLPLGVLGSLVQIVPTGNTGGSNVGLFKRMPISQELKSLLE